MDKELIDYFNGDELAASVWLGKYALKNNKGETVEKTPMEMHVRMAKEFARIENRYAVEEAHNSTIDHMALSKFGLELGYLDGFKIFKYFDKFKYIIPQGSIMSALGNPYKIQSLSNCFVVAPPLDSYGGIFKTDQEIAQLEKRRGGVGTTLNNLAPEGRTVLNAAGTSTGAHSFMPRYSNTTREVAQNGRRGALMLLMSVIHPDIFKFVTKKKDRTQVTGANISVQLTDNFMRAVEDDRAFICRFPIDIDLNKLWEYSQMTNLEYNKLVELDKGIFVMKIKAKELYDTIVEMAWDNAEPGIAFMDNVISYSPDGVYEQFKAIASNPCGEQWLAAYDACRLLAALLTSFVKNPFTPQATIDWDKMYEVFYIQQRLADDIVDLEIEYVGQIIAKIKDDPEPDEVKATELKLWETIRDVAKASRRTGCGFTGLADMLAMLNIKYDSDGAWHIVKSVMKTKMKAELDCTIDLAITRGTFEGWERDKEFWIWDTHGNMDTPQSAIRGQNDFYKMIIDEFPEQAVRMYLYGRRNVSWSTVAPTGSVSILTQTTSGLEPLFLAWYMRRKKVNPSDGNARVDFVDASGDSWQEYPVLHPKFKDWYKIQDNEDPNSFMYGKPYKELEDYSKSEIEYIFSQSPWYKSCANDIAWEARVELQAIIQRFTTNAISSTMNLPSDVSKETVSNIYFAAWKKGLKGITIYRDGCRTGVLVSETNKKPEQFTYTDAIKRPKSLEADLHITSAKGKKYAVIVGLFGNHPYEVFAFEASPEVSKIGNLKGKVVKVKRGHYNFLNGEADHTIKDLQIIPETGEEQTLTRLVSGMLRHGAKPDFVAQQIDKCELGVISFGKAVSRILNKYTEKKAQNEACPECHQEALVKEEGCVKCRNCGFSKC